MTGGRLGRAGERIRSFGLRRLSNRMLLLFFAITAAGVGFVYLYVVPQLESSLTAERIRNLEARASENTPALSRAMERGTGQAELRLLVRRIAQQADSRVTVLAIRNEQGGPEPSFVVADSEVETTATLPDYEVAARAGRTGRVRSTVDTVAGKRTAQTAVPISLDGRTRWVAVFSSSLAEVGDSVGLIRGQILIAGLIALGLALLAGYLAARAISRRLRRLEQAAGQVAEGDFGVRIPVDSSDELGQLARTFNEMQRRLERLDSARKEFIANASHELRTPIFSLGGFMELLEEDQPDEATREEFVRTMREQVERLTKLTTDLLDLSKLDADALRLEAERVDLDQLVRSIVEEFEPAAARHHSTVELRNGERAGPVALADPDRVSQIIRILLDNALTHTPEGTPVSVSTSQDNGTAEVTVSDRGPGIGRRSQSRVFERFYTGDSVKGSGLGLAIARELAMRMGGTLRLSSHKDRTEFVLELPLARRAAPAGGTRA